MNTPEQAASFGECLPGAHFQHVYPGVTQSSHDPGQRLHVQLRETPFSRRVSLHGGIQCLVCLCKLFVLAFFLHSFSCRPQQTTSQLIWWQFEQSPDAPSASALPRAHAGGG